MPGNVPSGGARVVIPAIRPGNATPWAGIRPAVNRPAEGAQTRRRPVQPPAGAVAQAAVPQPEREEPEVMAMKLTFSRGLTLAPAGSA
jgi:hypothetical protein